MAQPGMFFILSMFLVSGCDTSNSVTSDRQPAETATTLTVNVLRVSRDEQSIETALFFGKLNPNRQSRLGFAKGGRVKNVFKQIGETIKDGEKLAELEQDQLEQQKAQ